MTFEEWVLQLDRRHLSDMTASEVGRALRALSSCYVERRAKLGSGAALEGAGKRAAFALFYGVQHFVVVRELARNLFPGDAGRPSRIVDLGCGTGAAGAGLATQLGVSRIDGYDVNPWAAAEANWTYRAFELGGRAATAHLRTVRLPSDALVLAAYVVNELPDDLREDLLERLLDAHRRGASALVVEPIARRVNRWWTHWAEAFLPYGAREDEWRFPARLPERQRMLAKAAGLDVQVLTARSLYLPASSRGSAPFQ